MAGTSELLHGAEKADTASSARQCGSAQSLAVSIGARYTPQHPQHTSALPRVYYRISEIRAPTLTMSLLLLNDKRTYHA